LPGLAQGPDHLVLGRAGGEAGKLMIEEHEAKRVFQRALSASVGKFRLNSTPARK